MFTVVLFVLSTATIKVPDDFPTLGEAVSAATDGDVIAIAPGEYSDNKEVHLEGKHIVLKGSEEGEETFIKEAIIADGGEDLRTRLENLSIRYVLVKENASLSFYLCNLEEMWIQGSNGEGVVDSCQITRLRCLGGDMWRFENVAFPSGIGYVQGARFLNCEFEGNLELRNCLVESSSVKSRLILAEGTDFRKCIFPRTKYGSCVIRGDAGLERNVFILSPGRCSSTTGVVRDRFPRVVSLQGLSRPVRHNTFYRHCPQVLQDGGRAPGLFGPTILDVSASPGLLLEGNIIWHDRIDTLPAPWTQVVLGAWAVQLRYCLVSSTALAGSNGNICAYPNLADPASGDMRPLAGSPAVDAGPPGSPPDPDGSRADIGAFFFDRRSPLFLRGDVTGDGSVNLADAVGVLSVLYRGESLPCVKAADFNDNGKLALDDVVGLLTFLFAGGPAPHPPFPEAGFDTSQDTLPCKGPQN